MPRVHTAFAAPTRVYPAGALVDDDDPIVARFPQFFDAPTRGVEEATAAPGEKRAVKVPAAKKAAPAKDA